MRRIQFLAFALKEVRQTVRDRRTLVLLLLAPPLQLLLLGFAVNLDTAHVSLLVADQDQTATSRAFADGLAAGDAFDRVGSRATGDQALEAVEASQASVALVIPPGFDRALGRGETALVQLLVDGADSNRAIVAHNAATAYAVGFVARGGGPAAMPALSMVQVEPRLYYNPELDSRHYFVPGVGATLLMLVTTIVTAMGLAREREQGTLEAVMVTPVQPLTLVLGKAAPYAAFGLIDLGLVVAAGAAIFDVPIRGSLPLLFGGGLLYLLTTLGMGLYVASIARTQQQAFVTAFSIMLPMVLLSGFVSPIENMPDWLAGLTVADPMRHFVTILRGVLLKGATAADILPQLAALAGLGVLVFLLSVRALSRKLA